MRTTSTERQRRRPARLAAMLAVVPLIALAACGSDDDDTSSTSVPASAAPTTAGPTTSAAAESTTSAAGTAETTESSSATTEETAATEAPDTTGTETTSGGTDTTAAGSGSEGGVDLPDLSGTTLNVLAKWSGGEQESFEQVLDQFSELTGADINYTSGGDNIATVLGTAISGGQPPDVALLPQPGLMVDLAGQDNLLPIEDTVGALVDENFAEVWRELGSVDGTLYGVWYKASNKSTVWYRPDLFEEAGAEVPETWEDFLAAAQLISDSGITPVSVGGADGWTLTDWFENVYLRTAGPEMYDQLTTHEIPWTDPSVITAMEELAKIWGDEQLLSGGTDVALQNNFTDSVIRTFSPDNEAAIVYEGDFIEGVITGNTDFVPGENADYFPFPAIDGSDPTTVMGGGDIAVMLKDNEGAKALMQYLASPESAEVWAPLGGYTSPNQNVDTSVYSSDIARRSAEQLVDAQTFRFDMSDLQPAAFGSTEGQGMWGLFQELLRTPDQAEQIAQQLEDAAAQAFGG